jgi:hypothetical protein
MGSEGPVSSVTGGPRSGPFVCQRHANPVPLTLHISATSDIERLTPQQRVVLDDLAGNAPYLDVQPATGGRSVWVWCWSCPPGNPKPQRLLAVHRLEPDGRHRQLIRSR